VLLALGWIVESETFFIRVCPDRGEIETNGLGFFDIADPRFTGIYVIHAQRQHLDVRLSNSGLMREQLPPGSVVQSRSKVFGMGE